MQEDVAVGFERGVEEPEKREDDQHEVGAEEEEDQRLGEGKARRRRSRYRRLRQRDLCAGRRGGRGVGEWPIAHPCTASRRMPRSVAAEPTNTIRNKSTAMAAASPTR